MGSSSVPKREIPTSAGRGREGGREIELPQGVMVEGAGEGPRGGGQSRASGHVRGVARAGGSGCGSRWFAAHPAGRQPFS